ncbi:MAG: thioredoxin domain-containing protein [Planctomycetes bacterium]|nr:thioredoxin domain-containing protein [Planctomycetota bacterium]
MRAFGDEPKPAAGAAQHTNRLAKESSPYLLQHAHNPVDWYPWGEEAFKRAQQEEKPIFLSIGYSTCHWCHVMERESFENEEIAKLLNDWFVPIKVDREERPDVDAVYMEAVTRMTGDGGWPLTVFLTPDKKPFFGGTYFPPDDRYGRPGFKRLLEMLHERWTKQRDELLKASGDFLKEMEADSRPAAAVGLEEGLFSRSVEAFWGLFDQKKGGFGNQTKFPRSHALCLLLRMARRTRDDRALKMVDLTLDRMARGGMYDQVGGGFHRYSTDAEWHVPHFEKMLYDEALLAWTYLEGYQSTRKEDWARVARETLDYCLRDLADADGGFHSAEDADNEGVEGKFYVWTPTELDAVLGPDADLIARYYDCTADGNFESQKSILRVQVAPADFAAAEKLAPEAFAAKLATARTKLLEARAKRVRPHKDDKVLAGWNGLAIGALALGAQALGEARYRDAAVRAADFVLGKMRKDGRLLRRYRAGQAAVPGTAEDYAYVTWGLLGLYEATFDPRWLREARGLARDMVRLFADESAGGALWLTGKDTEALVVRTREIYDGATPSSNAMAALSLLRIGRLTADTAMEEQGRAILKTFSSVIAGQPEAYPVSLLALDFSLGPTREIVLVGDPAAEGTAALVAALRRRFQPNQVITLVPPAGATRTAIEELIPFVKGQEMKDGKPSAYVCQNFACKRPITDPAEFEKVLDEPIRR